MANEIDLYRDLEQVEEILKIKNLEKKNKQFWLKERKRIVEEIKEKYPDLKLN